MSLDQPDYYFGWQGEPITRDEWATMYMDERHIGETRIGDVLISTVWTGFNMAVFGPPLIFETMIFGGEHNEDCWRYGRERDAREGHALAVALVAKGAGVT